MNENKDISTPKKRACLGAFAGAHGVKGHAKLKSFTEQPKDIAAYGTLETEDGSRSFTLTILRELKPNLFLVSAPEIASREDAASLAGVKLYIDRTSLPAPAEEEFYIDDLVGLTASDETGAPLGKVKAVFNFGAGDLIELGGIPGIKGVRLVSFTRENVPHIDLGHGVITVLRQAIDIDQLSPNIDEE